MNKMTEHEWVLALKRLSKKKPEGVILYSTDYQIIACQRGVPSREYLQTVGLNINFGAVLSDMHDDNENGKESA